MLLILFVPVREKAALQFQMVALFVKLDHKTWCEDMRFADRGRIKWRTPEGSILSPLPLLHRASISAHTGGYAPRVVGF